MTFPSIDGMQVRTFRGRLHAATRRIAVLASEPGVNGSGVVASGWSTDVDVIRTGVEVSGSFNTAILLREQYRQLQNKTSAITVIDQFGEDWLVTVVGVQVEYSQTYFQNIFRVDAIWKFLPATDTP